MLSLVINGQAFQLGQPLPTSITSFTAIVPPGIMIPKHQTFQIRQWLSTLKSSFSCEYISINHTLIPVKDL